MDENNRRIVALAWPVQTGQRFCPDVINPVWFHHWHSAADSIVQIAAESQGLAQIAPADLPIIGGTFWWVMPGGNAVPAPCLPLDLSGAIYQIADGQFLVDETGGQVVVNTHRFGLQAQSTSSTVASEVASQADAVVNLITQVQTTAANQQMQAMAGNMMAMDVPSPGDGGGDGGTNSYTPNGSSYVLPDYGTNLWIAQVDISSGSLVGIVTNSQADISYEIQSLTDLTQAGTGWGSEGFILGSELTNWTPMSVAQNGRANLFLRIRSWVDSTGCGIPDWWQLQYFGYVGVDPYALDSAGDGWTIYQKFQMGLNPNVFYTPPAPQNLTVNYNSSNGTATVSWLPSPGAVTNYTVNFNGTDYNVPAGVNSFTAAISLTPWDIAYDGPSVYTYFGVQGNYAGGSSSQGSTSLAMDYPNEVGVIPGPQGSSYLVASPSTLPPGTTAIRLTRVDQYAEWFYGNSSFDTYWDIPVSSLTNGLYLIPTSMQTAPMDSYGSVWYLWWVETVDANGTANSWANPASGYYNPSMTNWFEPPYYDGRVHLKQNLIFQLRSAQVDSPFQINEFYPSYTVSINFPANYAYAGFYQYDNFNNGAFNALLPFVYNYTYRNFVFSVSDLSTGGLLNSVTNYLNTFNFGLTEPPPYYFQLPTTATNLTPIPSLLDTNTTRWLGIGLTCYLDYYSDTGEISYDTYWEIAMELNYGTKIMTMGSNITNLYGLPFLSTVIANGNAGSQIYAIRPGYNSTNVFPNYGWMYSEVAQPQFQTLEYDFWNPNSDALPGSANFSTTNANHLMITTVGNPNFQVAGYAKLAVANCYPGVYGYLGQYFTNAYAIDTNGNVTANTTGVLSPYGNFFATEPGPAALVTMPDVDFPYQRGTCAVYCVSLQVDKNSDGIMDLNFNGADATSQASPMVAWVNNWHTVQGINGNLDHDIEMVKNVLPNYAAGQITCQRDLENFFRLWICGMPKLPVVRATPSR